MQKLTALCERYGIRDDVNFRILLLNQREAPYFAEEFDKVHPKLQKYVEGKLSLHMCRGNCECEKEKQGSGVIELWPFRDIHPRLFKGIEITLLAGMYYYAVESFQDDELHDRLWDICMKIERNTVKFAKRNINNYKLVLGKFGALVNDLRAMLLSCRLIEKAEEDVFDPDFEYENMTWELYKGMMPAGSRLKFYISKELTSDCFKYIDEEYVDSDIPLLRRAFDGSMGVAYEAYQRCTLTKRLKESEDELKRINTILKGKTKAEERLNKQVRMVNTENQVIRNRHEEMIKAKDVEYKSKIEDLQKDLGVAKKSNLILTHSNESLKGQVADLQKKLSQCESEERFHDFLNDIVEKEIDDEVKEAGSEVELSELANELKGYRVVILGGHERWRVAIKDKLDNAQIHNILVDGYRIKRNYNDIVIYNICSMVHADFEKLRASSDFSKMFFVASKGVSRFAYVIKECLEKHLSQVS